MILKCDVRNCNGKIHAKKLCRKHYLQMYQYGRILSRTKFDPNEIVFFDEYVEIVLYDRCHREVNRAIIDLEDLEKAKKYKWYFDNSTGYPTTNLVDKTLRLHTLITGCVRADHINRNKLDNRKNNFRKASHKQNLWNSKKYRDNTSGFTGVDYDKRKSLWRARIKSKFLCYFKSKDDAVKCRLEAERDCFGEFAPQRYLFEVYNVKEIV